MSIFKDLDPADASEGGVEIISAGTGAYSSLTAANIAGKAAAIVCNTSPDEAVYYQEGGGSPSGSQKGIVLKPQETIWVWNKKGLQNLRLRSAGSGAIDVSVQYYKNTV